MNSKLHLVDPQISIIEAALAIAEERENTTRRLAYAVLEKDFETANKIAKELLPDAESYRVNQSEHRSPGR